MSNPTTIDRINTAQGRAASELHIIACGDPLEGEREAEEVGTSLGHLVEALVDLHGWAGLADALGYLAQNTADSILENKPDARQVETALAFQEIAHQCGFMADSGRWLAKQE